MKIIEGNFSDYDIARNDPDMEWEQGAHRWLGDGESPYDLPKSKIEPQIYSKTNLKSGFEDTVRKPKLTALERFINYVNKSSSNNDLYVKKDGTLSSKKVWYIWANDFMKSNNNIELTLHKYKAKYGNDPDYKVTAKYKDGGNK